MAYVPVPRDLANVKTKVLFNLTKRQLICFSAGALTGVPAFSLLRNSLGNSTTSMFMILLMLPFFLLAMYEKNGRPLEKVLRDVIQTALIRPKRRPYKTNNFYAVLERQVQLEKEVSAIVRTREKAKGPGRGKAKQKAKPVGENANRKSDCPGR